MVALVLLGRSRAVYDCRSATALAAVGGGLLTRATAAIVSHVVVWLGFLVVSWWFSIVFLWFLGFWG